MILKMLLTYDDAQTLAVLRENKKSSLTKAADFLGINKTTLHKYERAVNPIPIQVWEDMKVLYDSSLEGIGTLLKRSTNGAPIKKRDEKDEVKIIKFSDAKEKERNMKAMRNSELDNKLRVNKLLKELSTVF